MSSPRRRGPSTPRLLRSIAGVSEILDHPLSRVMTTGTLQRRLLVAAFLAGVFYPHGALFRRDAVGRAAFAADGLDAGIALLHDQRLLRHGFADQALGLFAHRLLIHPLPPVMRIPGRSYNTRMG